MEHKEPKELFSQLYDVIRSLREPDGCPWDQKQSPESIRKYLLEEARELADALSRDDHHHTCEEIGDMLFILLLTVRMHEEAGTFSLDQVLQGIRDKMIRRHPHVFAGMETGNDSELKKQWEAIKTQEKKGKLP